MSSGIGRLIASCLGVGRLRPASGTWGSAFGLALFALLLADRSIPVQIGATVVAFFLGVWASGVAARALGIEDPSEVVIDELVGMWIAMIGTTDPVVWVIAFLLFRVFDIFKPFPARQLEAAPGGWGVMLDDVFAGLYAWLLVQAVLRLGLLP